MTNVVEVVGFQHIFVPIANIAVAFLLVPINGACKRCRNDHRFDKMDFLLKAILHLPDAITAAALSRVEYAFRHARLAFLSPT